MRLARSALGLTVAALALSAAVDAGSAGRPRCFGAASRDQQHPCTNPKLRSVVIPLPADALNAPNAPCDPVNSEPPYRCSFGSPAEDAAGTVGLYGDSHATHWRSALQTVVARNRWAGISVTRSSCPFTRATPLIPQPERTHCVEWNRQVVQFTEDHPEITTVVVSQHRGHVVAPKGANTREVQIRGYIAAWKALPATVTHVIVIRDTPYDRGHTGECIMQARKRGDDIGEVCAVPRSKALKADPAAIAARRMAGTRVDLVDLTPFFCGPQLCYPVVGGALVHKDITHMSLTFGTTLGPYLLRRINALLGR